MIFKLHLLHCSCITGNMTTSRCNCEIHWRPELTHVQQPLLGASLTNHVNFFISEIMAKKLHQKLCENIDGRIFHTLCHWASDTLLENRARGPSSRWFMKMLTMCDRLAGRIIKSFWLPKSHVKYWSLLIWLIWLIGLLVWCLEPMAFSSSESSSRAYTIEKAWSMKSPVAGNSRHLPWPPFWSYHSDSVTCLKNSWTFNPVPHQADSPKEWLMQILRYWTAKGIPPFCFQKFIASECVSLNQFILRAHCSWSWIHRTASVIRLAAVKTSKLLRSSHAASSSERCRPNTTWWSQIQHRMECKTVTWQN